MIRVKESGHQPAYVQKLSEIKDRFVEELEEINSKYFQSSDAVQVFVDRASEIYFTIDLSELKVPEAEE